MTFHAQTILKTCIAICLALGLLAPSAQAAPLTGHDVDIIFRDSGNNSSLIFSTTRTVGAGPELTVADNSFLGVSDFVDIGADFISFFSDGAGPASSNGNVDIEITLIPNNVVLFPGGTLPASGDMLGVVQGLTERYLFQDVQWSSGGTLTILGLSVNVAAASLPSPGAALLLGLGLLGLGFRRRNA